MKKFTAILLVFTLALSFSAMNVFANSEIALPKLDEQLFKSLGKDIVRDFILERESEYYNILGIDFTDSNIVYTSDKISFKTVSDISHVLKVTDEENLPYVKGYLKALGVDSYNGLSSTKKAEIAYGKLKLNKGNSKATKK